MYDLTIRRILIYLPKELAHKIIYYMAIGQKLDLQNPIDLNQKIHYLIVYKLGELEAKLIDKFAVKDYINKLNIKDLYVAEVYAIYDDVMKIDLEILPNRFALKTTHGSGDIVLCLDKANFDLKVARKKLNKALKLNLAKLVCEYFSVHNKKAIICEEYIDDNTGMYPTDYKFWCFHGKAKYVSVCNERETKPKFYFYDMLWNKIDCCLDVYTSEKSVQKPDNFTHLIEIAEELSSPFPFVRLDLYSANGKVYFGEFTFTPVDGNIQYMKPYFLIELGGLLDLKTIRKIQ
jgi:hypothetical protein